MSKDSSVLSMSFLDVITCGMGSMLLLFFMLVVLQRDMGSSSSGSGGSGEEELSPFVLLVESQADTKLSPATGSPWQVVGPAMTDPRLASGPNYAVLYASRSPVPGTTIDVGPLTPGAPLRVQIFSGGQRLLARTGTVEQLGARAGKLRLWPPSREKQP